MRWTLRDARGAAHFLRAEGYGVEADIVLQLVDDVKRLEDGGASERARIVAWLRSCCDRESDYYAWAVENEHHLPEKNP